MVFDVSLNHGPARSAGAEHTERGYEKWCETNVSGSWQIISFTDLNAAHHDYQKWRDSSTCHYLVEEMD